MSKETRKEIAYWFFLIFGIVGVGFQMYEFFTGHIEFNLKEIGVTTFFAVFMFKPTILIDLFSLLKGLRPTKEEE